MEFKVGKFGFENVETEWWAILVTLIVVAAIVAMIIVAVSFTKKDGERFDFETRDLTYAAVCIAIAYALSFFGLTMPAGGSITFISTLPVMIYCYYFGFRKGLIICTAYMMLQLLQNPIIISPWSALLDYIIPYMALVFVGIFSYRMHSSVKEDKTKSYLRRHIPFFIGAAIYIIVRYTSHVVSGMIFFETALWGSMTYNSFVLADFAIAMAAAVFLLMSRTFNSFMSRSMDAKRTVATAEPNDKN